MKAGSSQVRTLALVFITVLSAACGAPGHPRAERPTPLPLQAVGYEQVTVRTLCLETQQHYYPDVEASFSKPVAETAQRVLDGLGIQVVAAGKTCDATLTIRLGGLALAEDYIGMPGPSGKCYTGARVEVELELGLGGSEPVSQSVEKEKPTPYSVEECPARPDDAPFDPLWAAVLLDGLSQIWGPHVFLPALWDEEDVVWQGALWALGQAGSQVSVIVPDLIEALDEEDPLLFCPASEAIRRIQPHAQEAIPVLIQALRAADMQVQTCAAQSLADSGVQPRQAVPALIEALQSAGTSGATEESALRYWVTQALKTITGADFADAASWQAWWETQGT